MIGSLRSAWYTNNNHGNEYRQLPRRMSDGFVGADLSLANDQNSYFFVVSVSLRYRVCNMYSIFVSLKNDGDVFLNLINILAHDTASL